MTLALPLDLSAATTLSLIMNDPDFTNVTRVAEAINNTYADAATVAHAGLVNIQVPADAGGASALMASLEEMTIAIDVRRASSSTNDPASSSPAVT